MRDRGIRGRRRGLNPTKVVFVYVLGFFLVCFHQTGRLADWFDDLALESDGLSSEIAFRASAVLRNYALPLGPGRMNAAEDRFLSRVPTGGHLANWLTPEPTSAYQSASLAPPPMSVPGDPFEEKNPFQFPDFPPVFDDETRLASLPEADASVLEPPRIFNPGKVLLLGDSMMLEGLGPPLQRELKKHEGLIVNRDGRYGTGLTRLDNFDWLAYFDEMLMKYRPDLVIITVGANDPQDMIRPGQRRILLGGEDWNRIYAERVADLLQRAAAKGVGVFWVGLPIMGQEPYNSRVVKINALAEEVCGAAPNCRFWDSWLSVADAGGEYSTYLPDIQGKSVRVRGRDKIHLTEVGGRIMAEKFLADTAAWADYEQKAGARPRIEAFQGQPSEEALETALEVAADEAADGRAIELNPDQALESANPRSMGSAMVDDFDDDLEIIEEYPEGFFRQPSAAEPKTEPGLGTDVEPVAEPDSEPAAAEPLGLAPAAGEGEPEDGPNSKDRVREHRFHSALLGRETPYYIALPEVTAERPGPFPVVFLLHGAWDGHDAWARQLGFDTLAVLADSLSLALVMPDGEPFGWYLDGREAALESYFVQELLPEIYRSQPLVDPGRAAITGLSMGGHGALTLALRHPRLFKAVGAMSAVTDLAAHAGDSHPLNKELKLEKVLGPPGKDGRAWRPHSAHGLTLARPEVLGRLPLILSVGQGDKLTLAENRAYHRLLSELNIDHVYQEKPGGHDWSYWSLQLPVQLDFLAEHLARY